MNELLAEIARCVERGKVDSASPHPCDLKGLPGADELTRHALESGLSASAILSAALIPGMERVGRRFTDNLAFVPDLLMAAKAMSAAMKHLQPCFISGAVKHKGTFIIGTVAGDLHDIGKRLVALIVEGAGYQVVDLGVDVPAERFVDALAHHPGAAVGLSSLLTTTMPAMEKTVTAIRARFPHSNVLIGGAPVTEEFRAAIGADFYSPEPMGAVEYLNTASERFALRPDGQERSPACNQ